MRARPVEGAPNKFGPQLVFLIVVVIIVIVVIIVVVFKVLVVIFKVLEFIIEFFIVEVVEFFVLELFVFVVFKIVIARRPIIVTSHLRTSLRQHGEPGWQCGFFFEQDFSHRCYLTKTRTLDGMSTIGTGPINPFGGRLSNMENAICQ